MLIAEHITQMFDTKIKTQKLNLFSTNEFYSKKSLNNLGAENQIIKTTQAIVSSIGKDNNVIFTTAEGDSLEFKTDGEFKLGDEVRLSMGGSGELKGAVVIKRAKDKEDPGVKLSVSAYSKADSLSEITGINDGDVLIGEFTSIDFEDEYSFMSDNFAQKFQANKKYFFEVKSITRPSDEGIYHTVDFDTSLVGTLSEILSDEFKNDNSFGAKILDVFSSSVVLKTPFGVLEIQGRFAEEVGANLVIEFKENMISSDPDNITVPELKIIIDSADLISKSMKNLISNLGSEYSNKFFSWVSLIIAGYRNASPHEEYIVLELPSHLGKDVLDKNRPLMGEDLRESLKNVRTEFEKVLSENKIDINNTWYYNHYHTMVKDEQRREKVYFMRSSNEEVRFLIDSDLSNIGIFQIDCRVNTKKDSKKLDNISVTFRHKNDLPKDFYDFLRDNFMKILDVFSCSGAINFDKTDDFELIENTNLEAVDSIGTRESKDLIV